MSLDTDDIRRRIPADVRRAHLLAGASGRRERTGGEKRYYVSYAWGDNTEAGKSRDAAVERLCATAEAQGTVVIRDRNVVRPGDRLSEFMKELGSGDRIFALLSHQYLRSPLCMTELLEVWRNSRQDEAEFCKRIRAFALPCARIRDLSDRVAYGAHWKSEHDKVEAMVREHGSRMLGINGSVQHQMIARIAADTTDLLTILSDVVAPSDFEEFLRYGFADLYPDDQE